VSEGPPSDSARIVHRRGSFASPAPSYGKPWAVAFKHVVDGLIFGLLIGGTFGWLWPG
jgi:hypothetical protein